MIDKQHSNTCIPSFRAISSITYTIDCCGRQHKDLLFGKGYGIEWSHFTTALATIIDSCTAIDEYIAFEESLFEKISTIITYGLFQSIILQQDSVGKLYNLFHLGEYKNDFSERIRVVRNEIVGHPIADKQQTHNFISYENRNKWSFSYISYSDNLQGCFSCHEVDCLMVVKKHYDFMKDRLIGIHEHVKRKCKKKLSLEDEELLFETTSLMAEIQTKQKAYEDVQAKYNSQMTQKVIESKDFIKTTIYTQE